VTVRRFFRRSRLDAERAREMQAHIDHAVDDLMASGLTRREAVRAARRRFGNPAAIREEIYEMNSLPVLDVLSRDLRYGVRMLRKTPAFTLIALVTLAAGIGVNTAVFTVVNALLFVPLPFPQPERLATLLTVSSSETGGTFKRPQGLDGGTFIALRDNAKTIDVAVQGSGGWGVGVNMIAGENRAANVKQSRVSADYFKVLGIPPFMGREFTADEDRPGGPAVAVLSHALWTRVFNGNPHIVGSAISLRGEPYTVVGVMPAGFNSGTPTDVWTPVRSSATGEGGGTNYSLVARIRPGISWEQASAEVRQIASGPAKRQFREGTDVQCWLMPLQAAETGGLREPLFMLWGAVALVLLIACVNVAGLLLARSGLRTREIATRVALGSGRAAVVRQLLVESGLLALAGGAAGIGVGWVVLEALTALGSDVFDFGYPVALDGRVLAVTLLVALGTSVVFGLVPAMHASRVDVQGTLAGSGTRAVAGGRGRWARQALVVGEVALGVVLLVGAGLLVRTFVHLRGLDPGFDPSNVTAATISLQDRRYEDAARVRRLFDDTLAAIRRQPGVEAAGVTLGLPYTRLLNTGFGRVEGATAEDRGGMTNLSYITPGYIEALRVPVRRGRTFTDGDGPEGPPVAIVNDRFVQRYYKDQDILGRHIRIAGGERQVVGIVGNARATASGLGGDASPLIEPFVVYVPASQLQAGAFRQWHVWFSPSWVVRSRAPIGALAETVRQAVRTVDPLLPVAKIETMGGVQSAALASQRFTMSLVVGLGAVALLLAAIGIHGLIASSVTERTRELGIRLALGASSRQVLQNVVAPGVALAATGVAIGALGALAAVRLLRSFLWGVQPGDPITFAAVIGGLMIVAFFASLFPALRILRLDPATTLRA
jgi:predicted permease